ncbi:MAG: reverse transcriptase-like protein [Acidobacteria bacterium]|nr:reverse transcriptase-like protein [Acidobacteriota bacterium]MCI0626852.1 reverse transcriptase-like protein [Acidobacteriota bacterium]MCI0722100.1 reverse transcriptase-like protein [Acidobacteriota bacterium]
MKRCVAYIDGGSRGNPGIAGYGVVVQEENGKPVTSLSQNLGIGTNNFAEYSALIGALEYARAHGYDGMRVYADSELMVRQINGVYKVKSVDLKPLHHQAKALISKLKSFSIHHVPREQNREADLLANLAMDNVPAAAASKKVVAASQRVSAIYRGGCFHPLEPFDLPENTRVHLQVKTTEDGEEAGSQPLA